MELIKCEALTLGYDGKAVAGPLDLSVQTGDYLCIVGENGSGKSTLMKTLLGLMPPLSGHLQRSRAGGIGYLPQQTAVQRDFPATAGEIVRSGFVGKMGLRPFYTAVEKEKARLAMKRLGVAHLEKMCYRELSGGQQQRVLLCRALCAAESLLILDEPTAGLDPSAAAELYALVAELNQKDGMTVIMVSHDMEAALRYADHILHIGADIFFGTKDDYVAGAIGKNILGEGGAAI